MKNKTKQNGDKDPSSNRMKSSDAKDLFLPLKYKVNVEKAHTLYCMQKKFARWQKLIIVTNLLA